MILFLLITGILVVLVTLGHFALAKANAMHHYPAQPVATAPQTPMRRNPPASARQPATNMRASAKTHTRARPKIQGAQNTPKASPQRFEEEDMGIPLQPLDDADCFQIVDEQHMDFSVPDYMDIQRDSMDGPTMEPGPEGFDEEI